jgi:flagellum-specific peptidoglycan hydrolase FlgJ
MDMRRVEAVAKPVAQKPRYEASWKAVERVASDCGAKWPQVVAAQWAIESGRGKFLSGKFNFFGIKGTPGTSKDTKEFLNGKWVTITDTFKDYPTPEACIEDLIRLWYKDYKGFKGVNRATSWEECCRLLQKEGYATDPSYPQKLIKLIKENN